MKLFGFLRKHKQTSDEDINPLDVNSLIRWYKSKNPKATKADVLNFMSKMAEPAKDQDHLTTEGELPWGWYSVHKDFIQPREAEYKYFLNRWLESRHGTPQEQIGALDSFVRYMNSLKKLCFEKGECFDYWRRILFTEDYLSKRTDELQNIQENFASLTEKYKTSQKIQAEIVPTLKKELRSIIRKNPNILQTDIYKMYAPDVKPYISEALYYMEKNCIITRTKQGRTYTLKLK